MGAYKPASYIQHQSLSAILEIILYRIYIRTFDGAITERSFTLNPATALTIFAVFVNDTTRDGTKTLAIMTYDNHHLFLHRFDRADGMHDSLRGRLPTYEEVLAMSRS